MADPLLTSLCAICHISAPKYKCPRCGLRTCSLPCTKKHKAWSSCSGERDATAYKAPSKLRTPAGIDHDYNFLHGIEVAMERSEKHIVEDKGLVQTEELRPLTVQEIRWKPGRDGRKRKVLVTRALREAKGRVFERMLAHRLRKLNVEVLCAPMGMARQRENNTTFNRRTGRVNWQVEWMTFQEEEDDEGQVKTQRVLSKVLDDVPLYQAYHSCLEEQQRLQGQTLRKPKHQQDQEPQNSTWFDGSYTLQDPSDGKWSLCQGAVFDMWPAEKDEAQRRKFQYFLARPRTRSDLPTSLTKIEPVDCLEKIISNTRVLEFPTIYVLRDGEVLPEGYVLGPKDTVPTQGTKRKAAPGKKGPNKGAKKRRQSGKDIEEGEVRSDGEDNSDDENGAERGALGLEAGDVIEEQSLGEEDDDDDDDETSSSGSDSEDE